MTGHEIGSDLSKYFGVTHYEPPTKEATFGPGVADNIPGPPGLVIPKYDVENFNRYRHCLPEGTPVYVTEKIHGCNARYIYAVPPVVWRVADPTISYQMFCGSRSNWKKYAERDPWHQCLKQNPWIEEWCRAHPNVTLYGEVFGQVQDLKYGAKPGELFFRAFDMLGHGTWGSYTLLEQHVAPERRAPVVFLGPFDEALVREIAEQDSHLCPGQCAEGVVICPLVEMTHPEIGRVQLKIVSNRYLERAR
jgi:RNA ligase (TIGR02306 family)